MRHERSIDASLIVGVVLASAVFATAVLAITGFAALAVESPPTIPQFQQPAGGVEGATGFALNASTYSGVPVAGQWMNFLITYRNHGSITETVQITDTLPLGAEFSRAWWGEGNQPNAGDDLPPVNPLPGGAYAWQLPDLGAGEMRWFHLEVWLSPNLNPGDDIINCAIIGPASDETTVEDNQDCTVDHANPSGPNLGITTTHEWRLPDYGELSHEIRFWNWGVQSHDGVVITDTYPMGTQWDGTWGSDVQGVTLGQVFDRTVTWWLPNLPSGATGRIWFDAGLVEPAIPNRFFTNTVEVTTPSGDVAPGNNVFEDVATTGGEVHEVDIQVATDRSRLWAFTPLVESSGWITVTTPITTVAAHPGPDCRCWDFQNIGPVHPGDVITVTAGSGLFSVAITVPDPFNATADSDANLVTGQIDLLDYELIEVALYNGPVRSVRTTMGGFGVNFPDVPRGAVGDVRYQTMVDQARVLFRRRFFTTDVVLDVHVRDNWIEGLFEPGHPVVIEVRESDDTTVKGRAELDTGFPPWWDNMSGFSTLFGDPWLGEPPDIVAGDWVHAWIDTLEVSGEVRAGAITGTVDVDTDTVYGTITAPWIANSVQAECGVTVEGAPGIGFQVDPSGGAYLCDFAAAGWDLQPGHQVVVHYWDPDRHRVINQFPDPPPILGIEKYGMGQPTTGGNFEWVVSFRNDGPQAAQNTVITDTLPAGAGYVGNTSTFTVTVTSAVAVFDVGTLDPGVEIGFSLFAEISAPVTTTITNTVEIGASNVVTTTLPPPSGWVNVVEPNDTDLTVMTIPSDPEPDPGDVLEWAVEVCNVGSTSSAAVVITDTVPASTPLTDWTVDQEGWTEVVLTPGLLVVERPTLSGSSCSMLNLTAPVPPDTMPSEQLCNSVEVVTGNDIDPTNNAHVACVTVGGSAPAIEIQKETNGVDADDQPGPYVPVGEPVEWTYTVHNTGNVPLTDVIVEDDQPGVVPDCPPFNMDPGQIVVCTANGVAVEGQYANLGTATGNPPVGDPVSHSDPSHYFGMVAGVDIEKATNGADADDPPGPEIVVGEQVEWSYTVRNTGNVPLIGVTVEDDQPGVTPDCVPFDLQPDETVVCTASGVAVAGQYENLGTATGTPPVGLPVADSDPSHYLGVGGLPFSDGFESGDTSAWSRTVP